MKLPEKSKIRVAICICTFRRQELLRDLLQRVGLLVFSKVPAPEIHIVIVDNDECASAENVCRTVSTPWSVAYVVEPRRGITYTRNRAIAEAGPVDFVAFIDDDEVPSARWLDELLWTQGQFGGDVVSGPVLPNYGADVAEWVKRGEFFAARNAATGTLRNTCACNNVLISSRVLKQVPRFDDAFALSGAEDTAFFLRVSQLGHKIVWSQEATVLESVSEQRGTMAWLLRREYQTGNGWVFCEAGINKSVSNWMLRFCKATGHIVLGLIAAILRLLLMDKIGIVRSLQRVSLGMGMLAALVGHRFLAYRNTATGFPGVAATATGTEQA